MKIIPNLKDNAIQVIAETEFEKEFCRQVGDKIHLGYAEAEKDDARASSEAARPNELYSTTSVDAQRSPSETSTEIEDSTKPESGEAEKPRQAPSTVKCKMCKNQATRPFYIEEDGKKIDVMLCPRHFKDIYETWRSRL